MRTSKRGARGVRMADRFTFSLTPRMLESLRLEAERLDQTIAAVARARLARSLAQNEAHEAQAS